MFCHRTVYTFLIDLLTLFFIDGTAFRGYKRALRVEIKTGGTHVAGNGL